MRKLFTLLSTRLLEETDLVATTTYQPIEAPEIVELIYNSKHGRSSVKKSFVLDSGRLQLEPVKETFGLKTVELILGTFRNNFSMCVKVIYTKGVEKFLLLCIVSLSASVWDRIFKGYNLVRVINYQYNS